VAAPGTADAEHGVGDKVVRRGVSDLRGDDVPRARYDADIPRARYDADIPRARYDAGVARGKVHEPVVPSPAGQPVGRRVFATLALCDEHFDDRPGERRVLRPGDVVDEGHEPLV